MSQNAQFWDIGTPCGGSKSRRIGLIFQIYDFDIRMKRLKGGEGENENIFLKRVPLVFSTHCTLKATYTIILSNVSSCLSETVS